MHLILDHVLESLIKYGPTKHIAREDFPSDAGHQHVLAIETIPVLDQLLPHFKDRIATERCPISLTSLQDAGFPRHQFNHLSDCHSTGKPVWVHDKVGTPPVSLTERHVLLRDNQPDDTLLSVTGGELISDLRHTRLPRYELKEVGVWGVGRRGEDHTVHVGWVGSLVGLGGRFKGLGTI